jgi:hypothetical protein
MKKSRTAGWQFRFFLQVVLLLLMLAALRGTSIADRSPEPANPNNSTSPHVPVAKSHIPPKTRSRLAAAYGALPLSFEVNAGQADPSVQFIGEG